MIVDSYENGTWESEELAHWVMTLFGKNTETALVNNAFDKHQ